jgi:hypothetical protein
MKRRDPAFGAAIAACAGLVAASALAVSGFPEALLDNSSPWADSNFVGAPDKINHGIGGDTVILVLAIGNL